MNCASCPYHKFYTSVAGKVNRLQDPPLIKIKPVQTFESLFRDPGTAAEVKTIFETHGYTVNAVWHGISGKKKELLAAYYVLKPILKGTKDTPQARIFYKEFGKNVGEYISARALTKEPFNDDRENFELIFKHLLQPKKIFSSPFCKTELSVLPLKTD